MPWSSQGPPSALFAMTIGGQPEVEEGIEEGASATIVRLCSRREGRVGISAEGSGRKPKESRRARCQVGNSI